ncbi:MAG: DUF3108 domain-containing protein [Opitutales bacterium]|nr:DUF3108 domain-containing protein [Opitutales bacterium]MCH8541806.1 DUF3108 domain-containing protein [Opitutales bacterium]
MRFSLCTFTLTFQKVFCLFAFTLILWPANSPAKESTPFEPGEELTFNLRWGLFDVGTAVLTVNPMAEIDGEEVWHFTMTIRTNSFADNFYRVRDRVDGYLTKDFQRSLLYLRKQEGSHKRDVRVEFDWEKNQVTYINEGEAREPLDLEDYSFDPLSVFFKFRTLDLTPGSSMELPVTDGRRFVDGVGTVEAGQTIRVPAGEFETVLALPDMRDVGAAFDQAEGATLRIWLSDDERRLPVRLSSRVVVGSFHAELVDILGEELPPPPPTRPKIRRQRR